MDKKILEYLVKESLTNNALDAEKVMKFAGQMNRKHLKKYIDSLKKWVREHTVTVESPTDIDKKTKDEFRKYFTNKTVIFEKKPDLIIGTRIIDNDTIYEMNLKDTLSHLGRYITE
jgi:hypothetical protein